MATTGLLAASITSKDLAFHESDYHTPRKKNVLLKRNSSACLCLVISVIILFFLFFGITLGIRLSGTHNFVTTSVTLGDTQLITFNNHFCEGATLAVDTNEAKANMILLKDKPLLSGESNIVIEANFRITDYIEYEDIYGWYDYDEYSEVINYVTWSFHLYQGSSIQVDACLSHGGEAMFYLVQGKSNYNGWKTNRQGYRDMASISLCNLVSNYDMTYDIVEDDKYYLVFMAIQDEPFINITLTLNRTEYAVENLASQHYCNATSQSSCTLAIPLNSYHYALLSTIDKTTKHLVYGSKITLVWKCKARQWIYVILFFLPMIFLSALCISMYCSFVWLNKRKFRSYQTLNNINQSDPPSKQAKLLYE